MALLGAVEPEAVLARAAGTGSVTWSWGAVGCGGCWCKYPQNTQQWMRNSSCWPPPWCWSWGSLEWLAQDCTKQGHFRTCLSDGLQPHPFSQAYPHRHTHRHVHAHAHKHKKAGAQTHTDTDTQTHMPMPMPKSCRDCL